MKHILMAGLLAAALSAPAAMAQAPAQFQYQGVGPVVAASSTVGELPRKAKDFIRQHYHDTSIVECSKDFHPVTYEVDLADGTEIEFNRQGEWIEVDAPDNAVLSSEVLHSILPDRARRELSDKGYISLVNTVKRVGKTYTVDLSDSRGDIAADELLFSHDGRLISMN